MRRPLAVASAVLALAATIAAAPTVAEAAPSCVPAPTDAAFLNDVFSRPGLGATSAQEGDGGGDYQHAYALPDGRVLWLFQDLHFSNDEQLGATEAAHNAGLIQSGGCGCVWTSVAADVVVDVFGVWS